MPPTRLSWMPSSPRSAAGESYREDPYRRCIWDLLEEYIEDDYVIEYDQGVLRELEDEDFS